MTTPRVKALTPFFNVLLAAKFRETKPGLEVDQQQPQRGTTPMDENRTSEELRWQASRKFWPNDLGPVDIALIEHLKNSGGRHPHEKEGNRDH
jgi:hypothetical protein